MLKTSRYLNAKNKQIFETQKTSRYLNPKNKYVC